MRRIYVGRNITEVKPGQAYDGVLGIGRVTLSFELRLPTHLRELSKLGDLLKDKVRTAIPFTLKKKDGQTIDLVDKEYAFFAKQLLDVTFASADLGDVLTIHVTDDMLGFLTQKLGCQFD